MSDIEMQQATARERMTAVIERRAVERGRRLTAREQLVNLAAALSDGEAPPKELDAIADIVLAYRPTPVSKPAKKRKRRAAKIAKETANGR